MSREKAVGILTMNVQSVRILIAIGTFEQNLCFIKAILTHSKEENEAPMNPVGRDPRFATTPFGGFPFHSDKL